jgi:hypothetical protein
MVVARALVLAAGVALVTACASSTEDEPDLHEASDAIVSGPKNVQLLYEGTCSFLHECSSWSRKLPDTDVMWGCTGAGACDDDDLWVAGPTRAHCNKHVRFCNGSTCTNALVKDISVSQSWEASNGVLDALGLKHELTGKCSGAGGGRVTAVFPAPKDSE